MYASNVKECAISFWGQLTHNNNKNHIELYDSDGNNTLLSLWLWLYSLTIAIFVFCLLSFIRHVTCNSTFKHQLNWLLLVELAKIEMVSWAESECIAAIQASQFRQISFYYGFRFFCQIFLFKRIFKKWCIRFQCPICCLIFRICYAGSKKWFCRNRKSVAMNFNNGDFSTYLVRWNSMRIHSQWISAAIAK